MIVDLVLILHVSPMTKITVTLFTIISTYSPLAAEKSRGTIDRVTTDSPYNEARFTGAWLYYDDAKIQSFDFVTLQTVNIENLT